MFLLNEQLLFKNKNIPFQENKLRLGLNKE